MISAEIAIIGQENWTPACQESAQTLQKQLGQTRFGEMRVVDQVTGETDAVVLFGGDESSDSQMEFAYDNLVVSFADQTSGGLAEKLAGEYRDERGLTRVRRASHHTLMKDVARAGRNRRQLQERLTDVGLDVDVYAETPERFIRLSPDSDLSVDELAARLNAMFDLDVEFSDTGMPGVFASSEMAVGGLIEGQKNPLFNSYYTIQDAASIFGVLALDLQPGMCLLDMCAAPGMKTNLAYDLADRDLDIVAIEVNEQRYLRMILRLNDFGVPAELHHMDARKYQGRMFDRVLVDAPCSSEGMIRKYHKERMRPISGFDYAVQQCNDQIRSSAMLQGQLLVNGFNHLKPGGVLVYSTCALNRVENEGVIEWFLQMNPSAVVDSTNIPSPNINYSAGDLGVRVKPGQTRGFYFAKILKI